jgi:hypothetical protein
MRLLITPSGEKKTRLFSFGDRAPANLQYNLIYNQNIPSKIYSKYKCSLTFSGNSLDARDPPVALLTVFQARFAFDAAMS